MPTTLEQLQASLKNLCDTKKMLLNETLEISLLDDDLYYQYTEIIIAISNSISDLEKAIEHIKKMI